MYISSRLWCRVLIWAVLVALGASVDQYDQPQSFEDLFYQDGNDIDTGPMENSQPNPRYSNSMLRKIISASHLDSLDNRIPYSSRPRQQSLDPERYLIRPEGEDIKGSVFKRLADVWGAPRRSYKTDSRPQQKWKIKKGKAIGSQMVCYFKLCAFRSPA